MISDELARSFWLFMTLVFFAMWRVKVKLARAREQLKLRIGNLDKDGRVREAAKTKLIEWLLKRGR